ncbi:hypothetical protein VDGL01_04752 [Verticillium dahliae]
MADFPVTNGVQTLVPPPEGYVVDFENPQQQKVLEHYLIFGILGPLAFIALLQRYYTKIFLSKGLQVDDAFMCLAWISSVVTQALLIVNTEAIRIKTLCSHAWEIPLEDFKTYALIAYVAAAVFMLCNGFTKLSLLTFYLHLTPQGRFRIATWFMIVIVGLYTVIITGMLLFHCDPVRKAFDITVIGGSCIDVGILYIATAVSNIVTDVILFVMPIPMVLKLHMGRGQKIGALIVFGIGSVTVTTSCIRLVYLLPVLKTTDLTWEAAPANIWSFLEANLFIICGSMPTLRKFFRHFAPRLMGGDSTSDPSYARKYAGQPRSADGLSRSRKQRNQYEAFDDNEMQTFSSSNRDKDNNILGDTHVTVDAGSQSGVEPDNHSEKAILQTKSFTVQYD